jgi:molybdopterin molybdotransferase
MVCQHLVKLAVGKLRGQEVLTRISILAELDRNLPSVPGRDDFVPVRLNKEQGKYIATPILGKSGMITTMSEADGVLHIPADKSGLYGGEMVEIIMNTNRE